MKNQEGDVNQYAVDELFLYAMNDANSYQSTHEPYVKNYTRRMGKGVYNKELGLKGIVNNYVPVVIDNYRKEHGLGEINKPTKIALGRELLEEVMSCVDWQLKNMEQEVKT